MKPAAKAPVFPPARPGAALATTLALRCLPPGVALAATLALLLGIAPLTWSDTRGRLKLFGAHSQAHADSALGRQLGVTSADLRLQGDWQGSHWFGGAVWSVAGQFGDLVSAAPALSSTDNRAARLTDVVDMGDRHRLEHGFDRLFLGWRNADWSFSLGRQSLNTGNGILFQVLDLFGPFAPTERDRDFRRGEDLLLVQHLLADGSELKLFTLGRRDDAGRRTSGQVSTALGYRTIAGDYGLELLAGEHIGETFVGIGINGDIGSAVWRLDWLSLDLGSDREDSAVLNLDHSTTLGGRNLYWFIEYFHSGSGLAGSSPLVEALPADFPDLFARLRRGELFTVGKRYVAFGGNLEWHPLVTQQFLWLNERQDGSSLLQTSLSFNLADDRSIEASLVLPLGGPGEEFGRLRLTPETTLDPGVTLSLRYSQYF